MMMIKMTMLELSHLQTPPGLLPHPPGLPLRHERGELDHHPRGLLLQEGVERDGEAEQAVVRATTGADPLWVSLPLHVGLLPLLQR